MEAQAQGEAAAHTVSVILVTGSCCAPGLADVEQRAKQILEKGIHKAGLSAEVHVVPAAGALRGSLPEPVTRRLLAASKSGEMPLPAVIVNGEIVSSGPLLLSTLEADLPARLRALRPTGGDDV